jgi:photosystem II stability/assembly factor-like uncharacterized protein
VAVLWFARPAFADQLGWVVGGNGEILHTTDGVNWTPQSSGVNTALSIDFVNANDGWAVGGSGTIIHTSDGGATWSLQTSGAPSTTLFSVDFVNPNNGWIVGGTGPTAFRTTNGGATWSSQATGNTLLGVAFVDSNRGWAVGDSGTVLHTSNGGVSWSAQTSGTNSFLDGVSLRSDSGVCLVRSALSRVERKVLP